MTPADRRFIAYWEDQRKGSRSGYYLIYTLGWGVVFFFALFFLSKLFTNLWKTGGPYLALIFIAISVACSLALTHFTYTKNEKRLHRLLLEKKEDMN